MQARVLRASRANFLFYLFLFFSSFIFASVAKAVGPTNISVSSQYSITASTTWTLANSPYIISGDHVINVAAQLTIEPGVVIKFQPNRTSFLQPGIWVRGGGTLIANGTVDRPIIFTSNYDSTVGGDTHNPNSGASVPLPGDWDSLVFDGDGVTAQPSSLSHVIVRYGGHEYVGLAGGIVFQNNSRASITDSEIRENTSCGMYILNNSFPTIDRVTIAQNNGYGFISNLASAQVTIHDSQITGNRAAALSLTPDNSLMFENTTFLNNAQQIVQISDTSITHQAHWQNLPGLTYLARNNPSAITVARNASLTIDPGVNIKLWPRTGLDVLGTLAVNGTENQPVIFTSSKDDAVGGDTNLDGSASLPLAADWGGIYFNSASGTMTNAIFRYGGMSMPGYTYNSVIEANNASLLLDHISIEHGNYYGLFLTGSSTFKFDNSSISETPRGIYSSMTVPFAMHQNSFTSTTVFALQNNNFTQIDATHNFWGDDSGPGLVGRGGAILGRYGFPVTSTVLYDPWIGKRDPVILVPGITGSYLQKSNDDVLWINLDRMVADRGDEFMDPLSMNVDGTPSDSSVLVGDVVRHADLRGHAFFSYFNDLIDEFKKYNYVENTDLFVFPYDWRLDNRTNAVLLKEKIDSVIAQTHANKVDLVAHSMGGLLAKEYMVDYGASNIDTVVFVGTPHLGSPDAAKTLLFGSDLGIRFIVSFLDPLEIKKIGRNMISLYELLPSQRYFAEMGSYFIDLVGRSIPDYFGTKDFLISKGVNTSHLAQAENFHNHALDYFFERQGTHVYNIAGCETPTLTKIIRRNGSDHEDEYFADFWQGDGTVPLASADAIDIPATQKYFVRGAVHAGMPSDDQVRSLVVGLVVKQASTSTVGENITQNVQDCQMQRARIISIHSPVDINVYDQEGNHVGPNADGSVDLNIPGVAYENIYNNKFVFLPDGQVNQYRVELQATASGTFNMRVADIDNGTTMQTTYYNNVPIIPVSHGLVELSTNQETHNSDVGLALDHDNSGSYQFVPFSSVLDATTSEDFVKPTTTTSLTELSTNSTLPVNAFTTSSVLITLSATDENSGLLRTEFSLDNGITWQTYSAPLTIDQENQAVLYRSLDRAGNMEETKSLLIPIDRIAPEVAIHFNTSSLDYVLFGVDASTTLTATGISTNTIQLVDMAGNITIARYINTLTNNNSGYFTRTFELTSVQKNTSTAWQAPVRNQIFSQWQTSKVATTTPLWIQDMMQIKNGFYVIAKYDTMSNETIYWQKLPDGTRKETGLVEGDRRPTLQTNNLSFIYY